MQRSKTTNLLHNDQNLKNNLSPDKAGGNKFSKDFEEGSMKLQEVVKFLEGQKDAGPALLEALGNADVFYEMQYKEVKIVATVSC